MNPESPHNSSSPFQLDLFEGLQSASDSSKETDTVPSKPEPASNVATAKIEPCQTERPKKLPSGQDNHLTVISQKLIRDLDLPDLARQVRVVWNKRLRTTAGRAYRNDQLVELNPGLVEISEAEVDRTLRHELAHLVAYHRAGRKRIEPHGREWRQACADLGIPGEERCHDLPFKRTMQKRKFVYECPNCSHKIYRVRQIRRSAACYDCCQKFNRGQFDPKFELKASKVSDMP